MMTLMAPQVASLMASFVAGLLVGLLYFGGLWWTVRQVARSERPVLITTLSWIVRIAFALAVFGSIAGDSWQRPVLALSGFIIARFIVIRIVIRTVVGGLSDGH